MLAYRPICCKFFIYFYPLKRYNTNIYLLFERNKDLERKQLAPGVFITSMSAAKFNRCRITIHLRFPAKRETATDAAVLALVLERGYAACPDMTALSRRLAELYGADLGVDLASAGTDRVLSADICGIKDAYALAGENLTAAYADIVFGTIFDPYLVDGAFDPEAVRIETETQARRLEAEFNSKRLYCVRQASPTTTARALTWSCGATPPQILRRHPCGHRAGRLPQRACQCDAAEPQGRV